jgi:feruloyl esterase
MRELLSNSRVLCGLFMGGLSLAAIQAHAADACQGIATLTLPDTRVVTTQSMPAGSYTPADSKVAFKNLPAFCRVVLSVSPVPGSAIGVELWLPAEHWNGRYQQVGTHRFGGIYHHDEMAPQLRRGFAVAATDNGHASKSSADVSWAFGAHEKLVDYAWRAVHETADKSKQVIRAFYGRPQDYAYFNGCSTGGRDGLKSAQMFPRDFNGILIGGSAAYYTHAVTQTIFASLNLERSGLVNEAGRAALQLAQRSAVAACDAADGVKDGVIRDPRQCHWDAFSLVCKAGQDPATCLTPEQAAAIKVNAAPMVDPVTHQWLFGGLEPSSEPDQLKYGYSKPANGSGIGGYQVAFNDPKWTAASFDLHRDLPVFDQKMGFINAIDPDLSGFEAAGGKLMQWHAWGDGAFTPRWAVRYYEQVAERMGGLSKVQRFYRLYMMSGAGHCPKDDNGPGAAVIGGEGQTAASPDAAHDAVLALEAWVEKGAVPERLIASRYKAKAGGSKDEVGQGAARQIEMQRPVCSYPAVTRYKGRGDTNDAANFYCAAASLNTAAKASTLSP